MNTSEEANSLDCSIVIEDRVITVFEHGLFILFHPQTQFMFSLPTALHHTSLSAKSGSGYLSDYTSVPRLVTLRQNKNQLTLQVHSSTFTGPLVAAEVISG